MRLIGQRPARPHCCNWNKIASTLYKGEIHVPLIWEDEKGELHGNGWARGFMRGMLSRARRRPEIRPNPITPDKREQVIAFMAAGLMKRLRVFSQ